MPITVVPNTDVKTAVNIPICLQASAIYSIPQESERCINLPASGTNWSFDAPGCFWTKTGGALGALDAGANGDTIYGLQPFFISAGNWTFNTPAAPNRFFASYVGVLDVQNGGFYGWYIWKNCGNQSTSACNISTSGDSAQNWKAFVVANGVIVNPIPYGANGFEQFRLRSDGTKLHWDWNHVSGGWQASVYMMDLPTTNQWQFHLNSAYTNNRWDIVHTFKGTYQGSIPITWTTPLGGTLTGTGTTRCFESASVGSYQVCLDTEFDDPVCVDITVEPLYFRPLDLECGQCVFVGSTVNFESNGRYNGVLTAVASGGNAGTVLDALTWQAPPTPATVTLTYSLDGTDITCDIAVVEKMRVMNVVGDTITGLIPGETFQIKTNYDVNFGVQWENLDCANIVNQHGLVTIPNNPLDECFGMVNCTIRGRVVNIPGGECSNLIAGGANEDFIDIKIAVDPVYPTHEFGGPTPVKWKPETDDYKVLVNEYEGGCDETYICNRVPVKRWTVNYSGLNYDYDNPCDPEPCCDDTYGYVGGFHPRYHVAARLDDFWRLVAGQYGYFTLKDIKTGEVWRHVRFEAKMERDHINWRTIQSRTFTMIWRPCCANEPLGGVCIHSSIIHSPTDQLLVVDENGDVILDDEGNALSI